MMNESVGLKMMVNPDYTKEMKDEENKSLNGYTMQQYWQKNEAIIVTCKDTSEGNYEYVSEKLKIKRNSENGKLD